MGIQNLEGDHQKMYTLEVCFVQAWRPVQFAIPIEVVMEVPAQNSLFLSSNYSASLGSTPCNNLDSQEAMPVHCFKM
jgi:hypothetical protein